MKTKSNTVGWALGTMLAMFFCFGLTAWAEDTAPTTTDGPVSTAGPAVQTATGDQTPAIAKAAGGGGINTIIIPVLGAEQPSPNWTKWARMAIEEAIRSGGVLTNRTITGPDQYKICEYRIDWTNLIYAKSSAFWAGVKNPLAPYNSEYGQTVWFLVYTWTTDGSETLSLSMIKAMFASTDGVLNGTIDFNPTSYTDLAVGIKANGDRIISGASSQKVKIVAVLGRSKLFNTADTQSGVDQVRDYIGTKVSQLGNYTLTCTVQVGGTSAQASVAIKGLPQQPTVALWGTDIGILNPQVGRSFVIQMSENLTGPWHILGTVSGDEKIPMHMPAAGTVSTMFFEAWVQ